MSTFNKYTKEECIESLKQAANKLGESPTVRQYKQLDIEPSSINTFERKFGSWNKAKEIANLKQEPSNDIKPCPNFLDISEEEWKNIPNTTRFDIRRRSKLTRIKIEIGCNKCGYDNHPRALDFHHCNENNKSFSIEEHYQNPDRSWSEVKEELKKCEVLCANCHRIETSKYF